MVGSTLSGIIKDQRPLSLDHLPAQFPGRDEQRAQLVDFLDGARRGHAGRLWIWGPPGTGKSSLVRETLGSAEGAGVRTVYLNCFSTPTFFGVVDGSLNELRALVGDARDVTFKFERLARIARQETLIIALDEIDLMYARERNSALYNITQLQNLNLICLSNRKEHARELDSRVRSRLQPVFIECPAYSAEQLLAILQDRAAAALSEGAWSQANLEFIASASRGDARIAITALRSAAERAEKARATVLRKEDVDAGVLTGQRRRREYMLKDLSEQHRLLHQLVEQHKEIGRRELWMSYEACAQEHGMPVMSRRTYDHYVKYLVHTRLFDERQGKGRGNNRLLRLGTI